METMDVCWLFPTCADIAPPPRVCSPLSIAPKSTNVKAAVKHLRIEVAGDEVRLYAIVSNSSREPSHTFCKPLSGLSYYVLSTVSADPREDETMANAESRVTIHMAASLDGFIARKDGSVDWLETSDEFADGDTMDPEFVEAFLETIDCYVMGSRTYETALGFEAKGLGWAYGDKPTFILSHRKLPLTRDTVELY